MKTTSWGDYNTWGIEYKNEQNVLAQVTLCIRHEECDRCDSSDCEYCCQYFSDDGTTYAVKNIEWSIGSSEWNIRFEKEYKNFDEAFEEFNKQVKLEKEELIKNGY